MRQPVMVSMGAPELQEAPLISTDLIEGCPVCTGTASTKIATGHDYEYETCRNDWTMWQCDHCSHAWLNPRPAMRELSTIYPRHYYSYDFEKRINPVAVRGKAWLDHRKLASLATLLPRQPQSYLDVGCGTGRFLRMAEKFGIPKSLICGIELEESAIAPLRSAGFRVECATVENSQLVGDERFDLITMFHVIEHVANPSEVVSRLAAALTDEGVLAIETPNLDSWDAQLFRSRWWGGYHFPRHWHIFTEASLVRLLQQAGLEVVSKRHMTGHSFWLFSFHHALKYGRWQNDRAGKLFHPLRSLPALMLATGFDLVRAWLGFKTSAMMLVARRRTAHVSNAH